MRFRRSAPTPARETYEEKQERERVERRLDYECLGCGGREFWLAEQVIHWVDITDAKPSLNDRGIMVRSYANRFYPGESKRIGYACKTCGAKSATFGELVRAVGDD